MLDIVRGKERLESFRSEFEKVRLFLHGGSLNQIKLSYAQWHRP